MWFELKSRERLSLPNVQTGEAVVVVVSVKGKLREQLT
jgi:hypothetical protein